MPFVITGLPERRRGVLEPRLAGLIDLAPTLLSAAGISHDLPGQDLDRDIGSRTYIIENMLRGGPADDRYAARHDEWKLIVGLDTTELYDLSKDPHETRNVAASQSEVISRIDPGPRTEEKPPEATEVGLSESDKSKLRALGYLD